MGASGNYLLKVLTSAVLYMILALGLNMVPGFTGLLDLGYVGFYGIGAYTSGLLSIHYDLSLWVILPLAAANGAIWGILLGAPTLRLTGDYFAIVTFGFSELVVLLLRNELWLTRGPMDCRGFRHPPFSAMFLPGLAVFLSGVVSPGGGAGGGRTPRELPAGAGLVRHSRG